MHEPVLNPAGIPHLGSEQFFMYLAIPPSVASRLQLARVGAAGKRRDVIALQDNVDM